MILALDPGPVDTAYVRVGDDWRVREADHISNQHVLDVVLPSHRGQVVCETMQSMGMAVGVEVFETCIWVGRYWQVAVAAGLPFARVRRTDIKMHLCGTTTAKDPNIRQALIDQFGPGKEAAVGTKRAPGPLYGVANHEWSALAAAVTWAASPRPQEGI